MLSYHNDASVKEKFQLRFAAHRAADEVIQGTGFDNGRGCFVGCTLDKYEHAQFPVELGWPVWLALLADTIFEGIPQAAAAQFGTDLLAAVPVGIDLEDVRFKIAVLRHKRQLVRLEGNTEPYAEQCRLALQGVIDYCESQIKTESAAESAAESAWSAAESARSAAWSAADSAAWSAAESAESARSAAESAESAESAAESAESAARSAAESARSAAWSAAESAAWSARSAARSAAESTRSAAFEIERDDLLLVLRSLVK